MKHIFLLFAMLVTLSSFSQTLSKYEDSNVTDKIIEKKLEYHVPKASTLIRQDTTVKVFIRCGSTLKKDQYPLVVIDGKVIPYENLKAVDPLTIATVTILKDASAVALYGSSAAYGAILVTLKCKKTEAPIL